MKKRQTDIITKREINKELSKIYEELNSWSAINRQLNYKIPETEIRRREFILFAQCTLYKIEDAKNEKHNRIAAFNSKLYELIKTQIKSGGFSEKQLQR